MYKVLISHESARGVGGTGLTTLKLGVICSRVVKFTPGEKSHTELQHVYLCRSCNCKMWSFMLKTGCKVLYTDSQCTHLGLELILGPMKGIHMVHKIHFLNHRGKMPSDFKGNPIIDKHSHLIVRIWWKKGDKTWCAKRWVSILRPVAHNM